MSDPEKFIIAFDTACDGWQCVKDEDGKPCLFDTEAEAQAEIDDTLEARNEAYRAEGSEEEEESEEFVVPASEYVENRKAFFDGEGIVITGTPYEESK